MSPLFSYLGSLAGSEYDWLGHFRACQFIEAGHNSDDAEAMDETVQAYGEGQSPNKINDKPEGA